MERVINAMSRCNYTYSRLRHLKNLQRCTISSSSRCLGRFEPDDLKLEPDIPEYPSLNVKLQSFDYVILEGFTKHVHKLAKYFELECESYPVPGFKQNINRLKPRSKLIEDKYYLNLYERVVQLDSAPSTKLPIFLEFVRNNCPQSVTVTVKEATEEDEEYRYVPDLAKTAVQEQLAELFPEKKKE